MTRMLRLIQYSPIYKVFDIPVPVDFDSVASIDAQIIDVLSLEDFRLAWKLNDHLTFEQGVFLIRAYLEKGLKIEAIKVVRLNTGWGLKESKDFIEGNNW